MRKHLRPITQIAVAIVLASFMIAGIAGTARGQSIVSPGGEVDTPPVTVVQRATPNTTVARGGVVSYEIVTQAHHTGGAGNVIVTLPYNPSQVVVLDATFSQPEAWVTSLQPGILEFQTGRVGQDKPVKATIRMMVHESVPDGTMVAQRANYSWEYGDKTGVGLSNVPLVTVGSQHEHQNQRTLFVEPGVAPAGSVRNISSAPVFAPFETVRLWYNTPDWATRELGVIAANGDGVVHVNLDTAAFGNGDYSLVAYGEWTEFTLVGPFSVSDMPAPAPAPAPPAPAPAPAPGGEAVPGCITCHSTQEHSVQAPHPQQPVCTDCHGESKPAVTKGCIECHTSPSHQNVVQMPHPADPTCNVCHTDWED